MSYYKPSPEAIAAAHAPTSPRDAIIAAFSDEIRELVKYISFEDVVQHEDCRALLEQYGYEKVMEALAFQFKCQPWPRPSQEFKPKHEFMPSARGNVCHLCLEPKAHAKHY